MRRHWLRIAAVVAWVGLQGPACLWLCQTAAASAAQVQAHGTAAAPSCHGSPAAPAERPPADHDDCPGCEGASLSSQQAPDGAFELCAAPVVLSMTPARQSDALAARRPPERHPPRSDIPLRNASFLL